MNIFDFMDQTSDIDRAVALSTVEEFLEKPSLTDIEEAVWEMAKSELQKDGSNHRKIMRQAKKDLAKVMRSKLKYEEMLGK